MSACEDCRCCTECGVAFVCLAERRVEWPCPHLFLLCGDCLLGEGGCPDCKLDAEQAMYESGEYDPAADPFHRGAASGDVLADVLAAQRADLDRRKAESGFDPRSNSYERRPGA